MEISEYKNIFENESSHFLYTSRHNLIISLLKKHLHGKRTNLSILDAGCGTGLLAKKLEKFGQVWAIDISQEAIKFAKKRGVKVKKSSVTKLPFKNNSFDVVTSLDVIYHEKVTDDSKALAEFFRVIKPGGILILRVPANKWLNLSHDRHVHTRERYNKNELKNKLLKTGFIIEKISFVNSILLPFAFLQQLKEKLYPSRITHSGISRLPKNINKFLYKILSFEIWLVNKTDLPFGIGLIAVCRKLL